MKKGMMMFLLVVIASILLMDCGTAKNHDNNLSNSFEKTQKVEVIAAEGSDVITTISDYNDIESFVDALKIDDWDSADIPSDAAKGKMFKMYQKETIKLNEPEKQKDKMNEVATLTTYKDVPYIKFNLKSYSFNFKVPKEVAEYLNSKQ